jgi:hypothetical protein
MHGDVSKAVETAAVSSLQGTSPVFRSVEAATRLMARSMQGAVAAQGHMVGFMHKRLAHDLETARALAGCPDVAAAMAVAQDHAMRAVTDYAEEMTALARLGVSAVGDGRPSA